MVVAPRSNSVCAQSSTKFDLLAADANLSFASFDKGPIKALKGAFGTDGWMIWPGGPAIKGDAAATRFFSNQPLLDAAKLSWQPLRIEISPDSTMALMMGVATVDRAPSDPVPQMHRIGRYLAAWQRTKGTWHLSMFTLVNLFTSGETIWRTPMGAAELPAIPAKGSVAKFVGADANFARDIAAMGVGKAFAKWAAPDAVTMAATGELNEGPARIGAVLAGNTAHWTWSDVAAGASVDGALGWTVGQATITPTTPGGKPSKSNLVTLWRRGADGTYRFTALAGVGRP